MYISSKCNIYIWMSQNFTKRFNIHTNFNTISRKSMSQNIKIIYFNFTIFKNNFKIILICSWLYPIISSRKKITRFVFFSLMDTRCRIIFWHRNCSCWIFSFRFINNYRAFFRNAIINSLQGFRNIYNFFIKINIFPT